jgi:hypothetical protein
VLQIGEISGLQRGKESGFCLAQAVTTCFEASKSYRGDFGFIKGKESNKA